MMIAVQNLFNHIDEKKSNNLLNHSDEEYTAVLSCKTMPVRKKIKLYSQQC